jgi:hypothetical protein
MPKEHDPPALILLVPRDLSEDFLRKHREVRRRVATHRHRLSQLGNLLSTRTSPLGRRRARAIVHEVVAVQRQSRRPFGVDERLEQAVWKTWTSRNPSGNRPVYDEFHPMAHFI